LLRGFSKRRGYEDASDLKKKSISKLSSQPSNKDFEFRAKNLFDKSDSAKLKNEKSLDQAGKFLEQNKYSLAVVAASSEVGDAAKDRKLTQARAKVVRDYLVQNYRFDDTRLKIIGLGKIPKPGEPSRVSILNYN